jgi:hypothetical protein
MLRIDRVLWSVMSNIYVCIYRLMWLSMNKIRVTHSPGNMVYDDLQGKYRISNRMLSTHKAVTDK